MTFSYAQSIGASYHLVQNIVSLEINLLKGKKLSMFFNQMIYFGQHKNKHTKICSGLTFKHNTCDTCADKFTGWVTRALVGQALAGSGSVSGFHHNVLYHTIETTDLALTDVTVCPIAVFSFT